jgi:hypothetical protein
MPLAEHMPGRGIVAQLDERLTESCLILSVLVAHRKPLRLATIAQEVQLEKIGAANLTFCL